MCLVEVKGSTKLMPACVTSIQEGMEVTVNSPRLAEYRKLTLEMLFSERNHICSVCVTNGHCDLQSLAQKLGVNHITMPYLHPLMPVDASHPRFIADHNRCILCTRCVRVCQEVEGAHTWDVMGRGTRARVITDLNRPWGESESCTGCGKCVQVCPTGRAERKGTGRRRDAQAPRLFALLEHDAGGGEMSEGEEQGAGGNGLAGWMLGLPHVAAGHGRAADSAGGKDRSGLQPAGGRQAVSRKTWTWRWWRAR